MIYKHNNSERLDMELFKNPTSEYRGAPFWAWNCKLEKDELIRQIEDFKKMGFGGFFMHPRSGLDVPYLSDEFMDLVKACAEKAKSEGMFAYLYDEDRYASGFAGGFATKNPENRSKFLLMTKKRLNAVDKETGIKTGKPYLVRCFDVTTEDNARLIRYRIEKTDSKRDNLWYVYVCTDESIGWFNNQTYADLLSKKTVSDFINITYPPYEKAVGKYFGDSVTMMFSDEPHFHEIKLPAMSYSDEDMHYPWTTDFDETFKDEYGYSILDKLPEIRWDNADGTRTERYRYFKHLTDRFANTFCAMCQDRCERDGLMYTGHLYSEVSLRLQSVGVGDVMRSYKYFDIPGIDIICNCIELSTAKQAQSAVHQYAKEGMLSEEYGVTGWDFDFRGHKFQADWQAALGVTQRALHLSWVSMKGCAKRDYPASISYQSPWYKEYGYIENHISRVNTVLTRGKPVVNIGVIHPIESMWTMLGHKDVSNIHIETAEKQFTDVIEGLLFNHLDFDFINEGLLPEQYKSSTDKKLHVGVMAYSSVIIPQLVTMRRSTLDILKEYQKNGGEIIFIGDCPLQVDGLVSNEIYDLYKKCGTVNSISPDLYADLYRCRTVKIQNDDGSEADNLVYSEREDGNDRYVFIAQRKYDTNPDIVDAQHITIYIKGSQIPSHLNTVTGEEEPLAYSYKKLSSCCGCEEEYTVIERIIYSSDSLLIKLSDQAGALPKEEKAKQTVETIDFKGAVDCKREEDNVLALDMAQWSEDGVKFEDTEEILRIDKKIRKRHDYPLASGEGAQPWVVGKEKITVFPILRFTFDSNIETNVRLAFEEAEEVYFNGEKVGIKVNGYFTDRSIHTMDLPPVKKGRNELLIKAPLGRALGLENYFLLGNFGVKLCGTEKTLIEPEERIGFGTVTNQGMPFYGGNLLYEAEFETNESGEAEITVSRYRGALLEVSVDDKAPQKLAFAPYKINMGHLEKGKHTIRIKCFGNRYNSFGTLHMCDYQQDWISPHEWYTEGSRWSYEYCLKDMGVISSPVIEIMR